MEQKVTKKTNCKMIKVTVYFFTYATGVILRDKARWCSHEGDKQGEETSMSSFNIIKLG
jgi:hypothetical protein